MYSTTLPIGEYATVTLLLFFGLQSIREAWKLPPTVAKTDHRGIQKSKEPAEEMSVKLSPIEVLGESFSLVFFAILGMGRPLMLATMALGAAQSPLGVASAAISGHLLATFISVLGGSFLSRYISGKLVKQIDYVLSKKVLQLMFVFVLFLLLFSNQSGYICRALFLVFAVTTFFGVF